MIVACWGNGVTSLDPETGSLNWELDVFDRRPVGSPIIAEGLILASCGDGGGNNSVVAVRPGTSNGQKPQLVYKVEKSLSPYVPSMIAYDDLVFGWTDRGIVCCFEAASGELVWKQRVGGNYSGSPVRIGDKLYCVSTDGDVLVIAAGRQFQLLAKNSLDDVSRSTPAVAGGIMYIRTGSHLFSIGGKHS